MKVRVGEIQMGYNIHYLQTARARVPTHGARLPFTYLGLATLMT